MCRLNQISILIKMGAETMSRERTYNFAAGPAVLPTQALERAAAEMLDYHGSGMSVMEMSHRSKIYKSIFDETKAKLKEILSVPDTHEILFLQGGASTQFSMVPLNLMPLKGEADYAVTGNFSGIAAKEAAKFGKVNIAFTTADCGHTRIPAQNELVFSENAGYFHYCANNTIFGTEWKYVPETKAPIVCDMSSNILSCPVDVSRYGVIYAGAQKNMAPAGVTVVIINKELAGHEAADTPLMLSYQRMIDKDSMYNTPPCWCIYMLGLTLDWVKENGGVAGMQELKKLRSGMLYEFLDNSRVFHNAVEPGSRSGMNVVFRTGNEELDAEFVKGATERGLLNLKGHRLVGGMRASIYNAQSVEGVRVLVDYMKEFEVAHHA